MPTEARAAKIINGVVQALRENQPEEAVRRFVAGLEQGIAPADADVSQWLVKSIGARAAVLLIKAFAAQPCFYCKKGLEACEACRNRTRSTWKKTACERCLDLGFARCDFCGGTGWVAYSFVPEGLRMAVIAERTNIALKQLNAILKRDVSSKAATNAKEPARKIEQELLTVNRLAGVLENALVAAKARRESDPRTRKLADKVIKVCLKSWLRIEQRLQSLLTALAEVLLAESAKSSTNDPVRTVMQDRAKFYEMLSRSKGFARTGLEHSFLSRQR